MQTLNSQSSIENSISDPRNQVIERIGGKSMGSPPLFSMIRPVLQNNP
jgi:hypothetical protein